MKKSLSYIILFALVISPIFAKEKRLEEPRQVITFEQLDSDFLEELFLGKHPDIAIECKKGTELPLRSFHNLGLLSVMNKPGITLKVEKTSFLRFVKKKVYVSEDLIVWERFNKFLSGKPEAKLKIDPSGLLVETKLVPYEDKDIED